MEIREGSHVIIRPYADCDGGGKPHYFVAEDGQHGVVTGTNPSGDHSVFVLFEGSGPPRSFGASLPLGRCYRPDELESLMAGACPAATVAAPGGQIVGR
jgi:hypothetical protein